jgi:hypothetical protein
MFKKHFISWAFIPLLMFFSISMELQALQDNIVLKWNRVTLDLIKKTNTPPTIAARALAIVHTSIFDAWAAYDDKAIGTRRAATLRRPVAERTDANKEQAISFAALRALLDLFPSYTTDLNNFMLSLGFDPALTNPNPDTSFGIGNLVALDILNFRHFDGSNQMGNEPGGLGIPYSDYTGYIPVNTSTDLVNKSHWQPLNIKGTDQHFLTPQWGCVIPFALKSADQFLPSVQPALYPSKKYNRQAEEVIELSAKLDDVTKSIVEYWADGPGTVTPPGHWNEFAQFISQRDEHTLDDDVKLFFILDNALLDTSIAVWFIKRHYDSVRPITACRFLFDKKIIKAWGGFDQGTQEILGRSWQPYIATPPFPEFVSGHSTFSSASACILKLFTGSDTFDNSAVIPPGSSLVEPGIVPGTEIILSWKTFSQAAKEAGFSRRLGGIHYEDGDVEGRNMGKKIGKEVFERAQHFIEGIPPVEG